MVVWVVLVLVAAESVAVVKVKIQHICSGYDYVNPKFYGTHGG